MTVGVSNFRGRRLTEARLARGLFKKSLADMIGVTGTAITRYEEGDDKPQREKMEALAASLNFSVDFFLRPEWPEQLDLVFWRSRAAETKSAREMTEQRLRWLCELFAFLEAELNFPQLNLPDLGLPADFRLVTPDLIEKAAEDLRSAWGLRNLPIQDATLALENAGIPVVQLEIPSDKQDGFCFRSSLLNRVFVGINIYQVTAARARYDLGHELGHAVLHRYATAEQARDPLLAKLQEDQAHRFASAFLFPKEAFLSEVPVPSLDYFCNLKRRWGISIAAMVYRAFNLGIIDDAERAHLYQSMTRRRWRGPLREPFDNPADMPLERPRMLRRGVEAVVGAGIFGRSAIQSGLPLPEAELEQMASLTKGFLREPADVVPIPVTPRSSAFKAVDLESGNVVEFPRLKITRDS